MISKSRGQWEYKNGGLSFMITGKKNIPNSKGFTEEQAEEIGWQVEDTVRDIQRNRYGGCIVCQKVKYSEGDGEGESFVIFYYPNGDVALPLLKSIATTGRTTDASDISVPKDRVLRVIER